jgi:hypothetical protein
VAWILQYAEYALCNYGRRVIPQQKDRFMKLHSAFAVTALLFLTAMSAKAQVVLTLDPPVPLGGGVFQYGGEVINNFAGSITITSANITIPAGIGYSDTIGDPVLGDLPLNLSGGSSFTTNQFFTLAVPANFPGGTGTYSLLELNGRDSNVVTFDIPGFRGAQVPEPGAYALLAGLGATGMLVLRRRK